MTFISAKTGQFRYFDAQLGHPDWAGRKVLDFGGNAGAFLDGAGDRIQPSDYWCLDVSRAAVAEGRRRRPQAHWVHYDRYNPQFNPEGVHRLPLPGLGARFDYVLAYSVFTHLSDDEAVELVGGLRSMLADDGVLAFTFMDPAWSPPAGRGTPNVRWRLGSWPGRTAYGGVAVPEHQDPVTDRACGASWCAIVDHTVHFDARTPVPACGRYEVFWSVEHARSLFPAAEVRAPVEPERQHCCLVGGASS
ncbi:hypothetical protein GCM10020367_11630 [Streptomyces sannanensis]|uniref:Methyltransferase type 12 domain-containing protein n=1 Tax=Streptomyces sannanensis TaxID=285536 RepID=A0ABP6S6R8_9ACTN